MKIKSLVKKSMAVVITSACIVGLMPQGTSAEDLDNIAPTEEIVLVEEDTVEPDMAASVETYQLGSKVEDTLVKEYDSEGNLASYRIYKFTLKDAGRVVLKYQSTGVDWNMTCKLTDFNEWTIYQKIDHMWQKTYDDSGDEQQEDIFDLTAGDYYLYVSTCSFIDEADYSFETTYAKIDYNKKTETPVFDTNVFGSNSEEETAVPIETDKMYVAQATTYINSDDIDWFTFTTKKSSKLFLTASTEQIDALEFRLLQYNPNGSANLISLDPTPVEFGMSYTDNLGNVMNQVNSFELDRFEDTIQKKHTTFDAAKYLVQVRNKYGKNSEVCKTGAYRFKISTETETPVTKLQVYSDKTELTAKKGLTLQEGATLQLTSKVSPEKAEQSVTWDIDDKAIATVEDGLVTAASAGKCILSVTTVGFDKSGNNVLLQIPVEVKASSANPDNPEETEHRTGPVVITKQKINLYSEKYYGGELNKNDKWEVDPKTAGSVSKGIFTAKKPCEKVTVSRYDKTDKSKKVLQDVTFKIVTPEILYPVNPKNPAKKLNTFTYYKLGEQIDVSELISSVEGIEPFKYVCSDKKGKNFALTGNDGETEAPDSILEIKGSGSCKVDVYYNYPDSSGNYDLKSAAKYTINIKSVLPKLPATAKVNVNKTKVISLSKVRADIDKNKDIQWYVEEDEEDDIDSLADHDDEEDEEEEEYGAITIEPDGLKCKITGITKGATATLVAEVEGVPYKCIVTVK